MDKVLAVILAGGRGERLSVLAQERTKPAVPFAGRYRIIDFTLSNCVNSGIHSVAVLTQYQPLSLAEHIGVGMAWGLATPDRGVRLLQPYLAREEGRDWYKGTADAVYQCLQRIEEYDAELVLVLSGDHVYKMDYSWMLKFHEEKQADVTLALTRLPEEELHQFGTITADEEGRVVGFQEKVKQPKSNMASMGIYLFRKDVLQRCLEEDAQLRSSRHDFGRDVFPRMVAQGKHRVFAYGFLGYWRDVGTIETYWQSNMDMIEMSPGGFLSDVDWPIRTSEVERPSATISDRAKVVNSLISSGCVIEGDVEHSVLSPGVIVSEGAVVQDSIILSDSIVGSRSVVDYSILDKEVVVEAGCHLGFGDDFRVNRREPGVVNSGITLVGKKAKIPPGTMVGRNCVIHSGVMENDFTTSEIQSGETIRPRRRGRARSA
ncbi:glucose-1-phosphate adenylyltransferase [Chloroflexota bacterium]